VGTTRSRRHRHQGHPTRPTRRSPPRIRPGRMRRHNIRHPQVYPSLARLFAPRSICAA
jgi:hypothetical protein